ncbi:SEL1-like repeat protein [uncultured Pseudodesulfovibrio sp.]|uniref:SEL1-like repeat protein n=1 Tax=uncultured Pseudodesulfovibrio sp. TaxID=2035858 RepID=UPI0029C6717B|nr:SEL1-like repeat protein [uncultured Pseudodesulfovibrio sp.]
MRQIFLFFVVSALVMSTTGCVENITSIHDRSEGSKALYLENDPATAHPHFLKAARDGDAESQHELAKMYLLGEGVEKDIAEYQKIEELAVAQRYPAAMRTLGFILTTGLEGVRPDPNRGMALLKAAADDGDDTAHYFLGLIYSRGIPGVQQDYRMAAYHFAQVDEDDFPVTPEMQNAVSLERMGLQPWPAPSQTATGSAGTQVASQSTGSKYDLTSVETKKYVQHALKMLGYYSMNVDGNIGNGSIQSIKAYQRAAGLKPTGIIDEQLIDSLLAASANHQ